MQMIFQDPFASLNPRMTVESILSEPLRNLVWFRELSDEKNSGSVDDSWHGSSVFASISPRVFRWTETTNRIARSLALGPDFIVADEPISALDVSIQAQIMNLLSELRENLGLTLLFIAHDLAAIRHVSDRIAVMYLGQIVELAVPRHLLTVLSIHTPRRCCLLYQHRILRENNYANALFCRGRCRVQSTRHPDVHFILVVQYVNNGVRARFQGCEPLKKVIKSLAIL